MWIHRVFGAFLAAVAGAVVLWMGAVLYGAFDPGLHTTVQIGIPGALLIAIAAGFALAGGLALMLGPRGTPGRVKRARMLGPRDRQ